MARVYYWYIPTANIFRHAYVHIYIYSDSITWQGFLTEFWKLLCKYSVEWCNWYQHIFTLEKQNVIFKMHEVKPANWKGSPQDLLYLSFAQVLTCLRRSLVFLHILSMATFKALLLSALSVCNQRERKQSVLVWDPSASTLCPQCIRAFGHSYMLKDFSNFSYISRASTTTSTECQFVMLSIIWICWIKTCIRSSIQEQNKHFWIAVILPV